jgi:Mrp family chromosome partitioning ATPase
VSDVLSQCEESADLVLIDSAPLLGKSDPIALAIAADAIVVVADAQRADRFALDEVRRLLDRIGTPVIGSVLTNSDRSSYPYYSRSPYNGRSRRWIVAKASSKGKRPDSVDKSSPPG